MSNKYGEAMVVIAHDPEINFLGEQFVVDLKVRESDLQRLFLAAAQGRSVGPITVFLEATKTP